MSFEKDAVAKSIQATRGQNIDAIFLTHSHTDHVANAQYFSDVFRCKVYISEKGLPNINQGFCTMPKGTFFGGRQIHSIDPHIPFYQFTQFHPCSQIEPLNSEVVRYFLGESSELLETPGHTIDSISILLNNSIAIVRDAMVNAFGKLYPPFADDEKAVLTSWKALLGTQCELFCPAHGRPISREKLLSTYQNLCPL
jgi:glyoxylase-like metal-dependent hydrolase (beta-lactamase superfamily II)